MIIFAVLPATQPPELLAWEADNPRPSSRTPLGGSKEEREKEDAADKAWKARWHEAADRAGWEVETRKSYRDQNVPMGVDNEFHRHWSRKSTPEQRAHWAQEELGRNLELVRNLQLPPSKRRWTDWGE